MDYKDLHFPRAGIDLSAAFCKQPNLPTNGKTDYARTTPVGVNVRGYESTTNRARGGSRAGLGRYITTPVVAGWIIQDLRTITAMGGTPMQTSQSGRVVTVIAVSQGNVYYAVAGATAWTQATNNTANTPPLNFTGLMYSTPAQQKLWFADGENWCYYVPISNTVETWTATAGALPVDASGNKPRLICTWRGRIVLSGLLLDSQNWFMSAVDDPRNFDYSPLSPPPTQAVAGNNGPISIVGDVVTSLIPYSDDILIFGCDHEIWVMRGDPMAGGQLDAVSRAIGMAWGMPWTTDPYHNIYFFSNKMGIYVMNPVSAPQPQRISQQIEQLLQNIDTGKNGITMIWDDRFQGLHVFVTNLEEPAPARHFFYEQRTGAWWTDVFGNDNLNPLCVCAFDGNLPGDRIPLIGSWDGYVRTISPDAVDDDGSDIISEVVIGPFVTKELDKLMYIEQQAVLGESSGDVDWELFIGATAEKALASEAIANGVWGAGRNPSDYINASGHAVYLKLASTNRFAMESIRSRMRLLGRVQQRGGV